MAACQNVRFDNVTHCFFLLPFFMVKFIITGLSHSFISQIAWPKKKFEPPRRPKLHVIYSPLVLITNGPLTFKLIRANLALLIMSRPATCFVTLNQMPSYILKTYRLFSDVYTPFYTMLLRHTRNAILYLSIQTQFLHSLRLPCWANFIP